MLGVGRLVLGAPTLKMHGRASVASTTRPPVRRPSFERVALARKRPGVSAHAGITDQGYHPTSLMVRPIVIIAVFTLGARRLDSTACCWG